jgi:hypothetical protein
MKGVTGILLVGGGAFLLIALFNGTLHFPFGQFATGGTNILGGTVFNAKGLPTTAKKQSNGQCPTGYIPNTLKRNANAPDCVIAQ